MKWISILIILRMIINAHGESLTNSPGKVPWKPDELHLRTGIYLEGIPAELPEDKFYPITNNLYKLEAYQRLYGIRLETRDLPRFERAYRKWGRSDGVFNVPEWINKKDEWDGGKYRWGYSVVMHNKNGELVPRPRRDIVWDRMQSRPYVTQISWRNWATLGQLCKLSDGAFVGVISAINGLTDEDKAGLERGESRDDRPAIIVFQVETNLLGKVGAKFVTIPIVWVEGEGNAPKIGMKLLVFYTRGFTIHESNTDRKFLRFDWEKPPLDPKAPFTVVRKNVPCVRILDSSETENAYIEVVKEYIRILRMENRDPDKYYEFLRPLVKSPVWRIRQDAKEDLLRLWGPFVGPERFDLERVLDDSELDWDLGKDYVRYIAIPDRQKSKAELKEAK